MTRAGNIPYAPRGLAPSRVPDPGSFAKALIAAIPSDARSLEEGHYIINDSRTLPSYCRLHPEPFRLLAARVHHQTGDYGWIGMVIFDVEETFRFSELRIMTSVAKQIAVSLMNIDLYHELEQFLINVVKSLVYAIEAKDYYTRGHSERVSEYCMLMADRMKLNGRGEKAPFLVVYPARHGEDRNFRKCAV